MEKEISIIELMKLSKEKNASDIHLQAGSKPALRIRGEIFRVEEFKKIDVIDMENFVNEFLNEREKKILETKGNFDTAVGIPEVGRFRVNIFKQRLDRVPACEIMFVNPLISRLIMEGQDEKIPKAIKSGEKEGMQDFETALLNLVNEGFIDEETALKYAENPHSLEMKLKGIFLSEEGGIVT